MYMCSACKLFFLNPLVSRYSTGQVMVAVMWQQKKGGKILQADVNINLSMAGLNIFTTFPQMFNEEENVCQASSRHNVLRHVFVYKRTPQDTF